MLTDEQFERARRLALGLAGIELLDRHRGLLQRRRARLAMHEAFDAWLGAAEDGDADACRRLIELFTTTFTGFFRHPWHFHLAAEHALWAVHRRGPARLWSAAAATGEEPYSLAMTLIEVFRCEDPAVTILATDIDEGALGVARDGEYSEAALGALSPPHLARFVGEPTGGGRRSLIPAVRRLVEFRRLNLADVVWPLDGVFDVVFCRNVLMYLDERATATRSSSGSPRCSSRVACCCSTRASTSGERRHCSWTAATACIHVARRPAAHPLEAGATADDDRHGASLSC